MKNNEDMTCLADGLVVPADMEKTGLNLNEIVVGPTGCGKSFSNAFSRLLHTTLSSVVVPVAKKEIKEKFSRMFRDRGYEVAVLDYAEPENCIYGYDPLDYVKRDEDVLQLARTIIQGKPKGDAAAKNTDPYWADSATSVLAAEISLILLNARSSGKKAVFADVVELNRTYKPGTEDKLSYSNLDYLFDRAAEEYPGNQASELWKTIKGISAVTSSCIMSIVNESVNSIFSDSVLEMTRKEKRIRFEELGEKKIALFVITSPMNFTLKNLINLMYSDMFRALFESAQKNNDGKLKVPVHIIFDDFACGSRIIDFEDYISIFRGAGISVTLLLQSESQLFSMYGEYAAKTIVNNCDTYVYMGGSDSKTCTEISQRANLMPNTITSLPLERVIVFRRGHSPYFGRRYQTLNDPVYKELIKE